MNHCLTFTIATLIFSVLCGSAECSGWQAITNQPPCTARDETSLTALDGKLYLVGGRQIDPVEEYDPSTNGWKKLASPPMELNHFQAVPVDGKIAVVGAMTGRYPHETPVPNLWWFDPKKNEWTKGFEIPEARRRGSVGAVYSEGKLYLVCGIIDGHWKGFVPWLDSLDLKTGTWTILPDAPHARDHLNAALVDGKIVAVDGRTSFGEQKKVFNLVVPEVDVYDIAKNQWSTLPKNLPTPRAGAMVAARDGKVVVIGGESAQRPAHNQTECLTLATGEWETLSPLTVPTHGTGAAFLGDKLYVVSGVSDRGGKPKIDTMQMMQWPFVK